MDKETTEMVKEYFGEGDVSPERVTDFIAGVEATKEIAKATIVKLMNNIGDLEALVALERTLPAR